METSRQVYKNIETRVLVRKTGAATENWVGYTYQWDGADAKLVDSFASPSVNLTIDASAEGGARKQAFQIPSRNDCLICHNSSVGFVRESVTYVKRATPFRKVRTPFQ